MEKQEEWENNLIFDNNYSIKKLMLDKNIVSILDKNVKYFTQNNEEWVEISINEL